MGTSTKKQNKRRNHPLAVLEGSLSGTIADQFVWCRGKCTKYTDTSCKFHLWITILIKFVNYDLLFWWSGYTLLIPAVLVDLYQYPSFTLPCPLSPEGMLYFNCDCPREDLTSGTSCWLKSIIHAPHDHSYIQENFLVCTSKFFNIGSFLAHHSHDNCNWSINEPLLSHAHFPLPYKECLSPFNL